MEAPITVDFSGIVLLPNQSTPTVTAPFTISNAGLSPLTILGYAYTTDELDDDDVDYTNATATDGTYDLGVGFTSNNLPPVGTVIQGGGQVAVDLVFNPINGVGAYQSYLLTWSDGGSTSIILEGSASTAPVANFSISNSEGGWLPPSNLLMDFGKVAPGTTSERQIRICNEGGSVLEVSKSKPPNGAFRPEDPTSLHESQTIPVNECAYATVLFVTVAEEPNVPDQTYTNTWTLNTDDLNFGVHVVEIRGTLVSRKVGPTNSTGDAVYTYLGCYTERTGAAGRLLPTQQYADNNNDNGRCQTDCGEGNFVFSGTEYQTECYCGNKPPPSSFKADEARCSFACSGDATQNCGGAGGYVSIYYDATRYTPGNDTGVTNPTDPTGPTDGPKIVNTTGNYNYIGCYSEATTGRALSGKAPPTPPDGGSIENCEKSCQGYTYFGMEYANECYCGNTLNAGSVKHDDGDCSMICGGNENEYCGGPDRLNLYKINGSLPAPTTTAGGTEPTGSTGGPTVVPSAGAFSYAGCYTEATNGRALSGLMNPVAGATLTIEKCAAACSKYAYFGTEYSGECYCGNSFNAGAVLATGDNDVDKGCSMTCNGDQSQYCGGPNRLTAYRKNATATNIDIASSTLPSSSTAALSTPTGPSVPNDIAGYSYQGCYTEGTSSRALTGLQNPVPGAKLTNENCGAACMKYTYFGTEYSGECYCGNTLAAGSVLAASRDCSMTCNGNATQFCGGPNRLTLYKKASASQGENSTTTAASTSTAPTPAGPTAVQTVGDYVFQGCWSEATTGRALTAAAFYNDSMTVELCAQNCRGHTMFGVEYGRECYCGTSPAAGSIKVANQADCNMKCPGAPSEYCGAGNRLNMYQLKSVATTAAAKTVAAESNSGTTAPTTSKQSLASSKTSTNTSGSAVKTTTAKVSAKVTTASTFSSTSSSASSSKSGTTSSTTSKSSTSTTTTSSARTVTPTTGSVTNGWAYLGCANETTPRALSGASYSSNTAMTIEKCQAFCSSSNNNYGLAGIEYGGECYCGNALQSYSAVGHDGCNMACTGNKTELCGGPSRLSVYNLTTYVPPTTVKQVGTYLSQGCYQESSNGRLLSGKSYTNHTGMTVETCVEFCQASGSAYAGLEYAQECYCGSTLSSSAVTADASKCNMLCTGNSNEFCGASSLLNVYKNTPSSVSSAGTPMTANTLNKAVIKPNTTEPAPESKAKRAAKAERSVKLRFARHEQV